MRLSFWRSSLNYKWSRGASVSFRVAVSSFIWAAIFVHALLFSVLAHADVKLSKTIKAGTGPKAKFSQVVGMFVDKHGTLHLIDSKTGKLVSLGSSTSSAITLAGKDAVFRSTRLGGLAPIDDSLIAVVNTSEASIAILDKAGKLQYAIGENGRPDGRLSSPGAIAYSPRGRLYVADTGNGRISVYSRDGVFLFSLGNRDLSGKTNLKQPTHVAVDAQEHVYVLDNENGGRISVYSHSGKLLKRATAATLQAGTRKPPKLSAMAVSIHGEIFLADQGNGKILQFDWRKGRMVGAFGSRGKGRGQFLRITALAVTPSHQLAVSDMRNKKIEIYDLPRRPPQPATEDLRLPSVRLGKKFPASCDRAYPMAGDLILCISTAKRTVTRVTKEGKVVGSFDGAFKHPTLAAIGEKDVIIVDGKQLKVYSHDGKLRFAFGRGGSKDGRFKQITGIYLRGKIYVSDTGKRVQIFSPDGIFLDKLANRKGEPEIIRDPGPIVVDSKGNLYVADNGFARLRVFSPKKKLLYELGEGEKSLDRYKQFKDMTLDQDDILYVLASTVSNENAVHVYHKKGLRFSFGSWTERRAGLSEPTSLTVPASKETTVKIYDRKRQALQGFEFLQVPRKVGGLVVGGGVQKTKLSWQQSPGGFVDHYMVFAANEEAGPYDEILETLEDTATVTHGEGRRYVYYRVAAVSGFGVQGPASQHVGDLFQAGYGLYEAGKYSEASKLFASLVQKNRKHGEALEYLALSLAGQKKYDEAIRRFQVLTKMPGFEIIGVNHQTKSLFDSNQFIKARTVVDKAIAQGRADAVTYLWCGKVGLKLGDDAGAANCLERSIELDEGIESTHFLLGQAYLRIGAIDKGLAQFDQAVKVAPENINAWVQSGRAYQSLDKHEEALARFNKALAIDKLHGDARLGAAQSHIRLKGYDEARAIALSMSGIPKQEAAGRYLLGLIALANDRPQEAILSLTKSTKKDPEKGDVWVALAEAYIQIADQERARTALRQAITVEPASFQARLRLAMLEQEGKNHLAATKEFDRVVKMRPDHYAARYGYALSLLALERFREASEQAKEAARLLPKSSEALVLLADIGQQQGKAGEAIDYMKKALAREPTSTAIEIKLGKLYLQNNIFDLAQQHLETAALKDTQNAAPHNLLGHLYLKRRLYDEAIMAFTRAVELDATDENKLRLNTAYAEKRKSLEFAHNAPLIVLQDLRLDRVFSAAYKKYTNAPVGHIKVVNTGETEYKNLKLTFHIKEYMDFPTSRDIELLNANESVEIPLLAAFNNKVLNIDEDTGILVEVKLNFYRGGERDSIDITQPMTIYGKNAMVWGESDMVGSFVTPKDETLKDFVRQAVNSYRPEKGPLNDNIVSAMTWFNVLSAYGMKYIVDPNNPFPELTKDQVDYVQFPRETLKVKSGDCDDLSVLLSAGLENLGIETALVDIPGHLFLMFNTGLPAKNKGFVSLHDDLMVIRNGKVWIPLEATMIATSFSEAWAEGARKYRKWTQKNKLQVMPVKKAWKQFRPVTLAPANYTVRPPAGGEVKNFIERERAVLIAKAVDRFIAPYRALLRDKPGDQGARMQIAIIYAKSGLDELAFEELDRILQVNPENSAAHNNRGNIYYLQGKYDRALEAYGRAEELDPNDAGIKINLSLTHYRLGRLKEAIAKHSQAVALNSTIAQKYEALSKLLTH